jgi:hypothetical protein
MRARCEKGSILIITLVVMAMAAGLASYVVGLSKRTIGNAGMILDKLQCRIEAGSRLEEIKFLFASGQFGAAHVTVTPFGDADPKQSSWSLRGDPVRVGNSLVEVYDTGRKPALNKLSPAGMKRLFVAGGMDANMAAAVSEGFRDWIDGDNLKHLNGGEADYYRREKRYGYGPRNSPAVQAVEEVRLLRGLEGSEVAGRVAGSLYLFGGGDFNVNTASPEMMEVVLNIPARQARDLAALRRQKGRIAFEDLRMITGRDFSFDFSGVSVYTTRVVDVTIGTSIGRAGDSVRALIDFKPDAKAPYRVIRYQE